MQILGIDTATRYASAGLWRDGQIIAELTEKGQRSHAVSLLPLIERVLSEARTQPRNVDGIAVSCGPGSFTGLRVGLSVAKGLACATGARLVGVPTLEALAHTVQREGIVCAALDARRGDLYAALFDRSAQATTRLTADRVVTFEALTDILASAAVMIGDAVPAYGQALRARFGDRLEILPFDEYGPRGGVIAALGAAAVDGGVEGDAAVLEPAYLQPCEAERSLA